MKETYDFPNVEVEPLFKDMVDFETFSKSDFRAVKVKECEAVPKSKKLLKLSLIHICATKIIIPSEIQGIAGLVTSLVEVAGKEKEE